jgi:hypothetical protein
MEEKERQAAFMSALTTEHFVLQTAASSTTSEAAGRASLYVVTLSSSLVAMGFASQSRQVFIPFAATVLPAVFLLGVFTVFRLVDTGLESMLFLTGIARIRSYYRTLTPEAAEYFSAERGRWPETQSAPALRLGTLVAFFTTNASMVAFINSIVAGAGVGLLVGYRFPSGRTALSLPSGVATAVALMAAFLAYQRWRYRIVDSAVTEHDSA